AALALASGWLSNLQRNIMGASRSGAARTLQGTGPRSASSCPRWTFEGLRPEVLFMRMEIDFSFCLRIRLRCSRVRRLLLDFCNSHHRISQAFHRPATVCFGYHNLSYLVAPIMPSLQDREFVAELCRRERASRHELLQGGAQSLFQRRVLTFSFDRKRIWACQFAMTETK